MKAHRGAPAGDEQQEFTWRLLLPTKGGGLPCWRRLTTAGQWIHWLRPGLARRAGGLPGGRKCLRGHVRHHAPPQEPPIRSGDTRNVTRPPRSAAIATTSSANDHKRTEANRRSRSGTPGSPFGYCTAGGLRVGCSFLVRFCANRTRCGRGEQSDASRVRRGHLGHPRPVPAGASRRPRRPGAAPRREEGRAGRHRRRPAAVLVGDRVARARRRAAVVPACGLTNAGRRQDGAGTAASSARASRPTSSTPGRR